MVLESLLDVILSGIFLEDFSLPKSKVDLSSSSYDAAEID